jgi:AcrR family transcriptional regulator
MSELAERRVGSRARIVHSAAELLREEGASAVTTRRVAEKAGVQPPAIYRLFGDKDGLLEAVVEHVMHRYATSKGEIVDEASAQDVDPLDDLRDGWQAQIAFGVANPTLFRLLSDPERVSRSQAAATGRQVLRRRVHRLAAAGRLRVSEARAVAMIQAAGIGVIQTLLATPPDQRDPELPDVMYRAVMAQILADGPAAADGTTLTAAVTFQAIAPQLTMLSDAERQLLDDWLARVVASL